ATVWSSESTICAGTSPATIPQNRQSLPSTGVLGRCRTAPAAACAVHEWVSLSLSRSHELPGERHRVVAICDLARVDGLLDLDDAHPFPVVADEGDVVAVDPARRGLPHVVHDGTKTQCPAPGQLVGERLGELLGDLRRTVARVPLQVGLDLEQLPQDLDRVTVDIEMVIRVLLDTAERLELRQDRRRRP